MSDDRSTTLALAAEFPPATREQWLKLVDGILKGAPFERRLVARTYDGLAIQPLHARDPGARAIPGRPAQAPWQVMQRVDHPDPAAANAEALHDLENGARGLAVILPGAVGDHGFGVAPAGLARILDEVRLDAGISVEFDMNSAAKDAAFDFLALVKARGVKPEATDVRFGFDPIGQMARNGSAPASWDEIAPGIALTVKKLAGEGFSGPFFAADGRIVHAAGGSQAQELAYALACAAAYLRALEAADCPLDSARGMIFFRLAADADQFLTLAKFRGLRKLWARIEQACGLAPRPAFVCAETAWRMMTKRDPWVNMLRSTVAVFAAGLGGANAVTVLPFTAALGLPDRFARRMARNTQLVLLEESSLDKVTDPAAGSGGIEDLTDQLCRAAWTLFQEIEAAGGAAAALEQGLIQAKVADVRAARARAIAHRTDALTGTSEFPDLHEAPVSVLDVKPNLPQPGRQERKLCEALPRVRLAEPFERLRDASDRALERTGARPKIFLANLGLLSDFTARATFAKNFFEAGGIEAVATETSKNGQDLAAAFRTSGARIACLCSSDEVYAREAAATAKRLIAAGAIHVYLAGRPKNLEAALRAAGVNTFVYSGCDALATLTAAHDILGIGP